MLNLTVKEGFDQEYNNNSSWKMFILNIFLCIWFDFHLFENVQFDSDGLDKFLAMLFS